MELYEEVIIKTCTKDHMELFMLLFFCYSQENKNKYFIKTHLQKHANLFIIYKQIILHIIQHLQLTGTFSFHFFFLRLFNVFFFVLLIFFSIQVYFIFLY